MGKKSFTHHPLFPAASAAANKSVQVALAAMGCKDRDVYGHEAMAGRMIDDFVRLLLHAYDAKEKRGGR